MSCTVQVRVLSKGKRPMRLLALRDDLPLEGLLYDIIPRRTPPPLLCTEMNDFESYFAFKAIVKTLATLRVKIAARRHVHQMYWSRLQGVQSPEEWCPCEGLSALLPSRRLWRRGKKEMRVGKSTDTISSESIVRVVCGKQKAGCLSETEWGVRLLNFCDSTRERAFQGDMAFSPPRIALIRKDGGRVKTMKKKLRREAYRCLSSFENLADRVLIGRTAAYLRDVFDPLFSRGSYAFRSNSREFSLHTAIEDLFAFRKRFAGKTLCVADCDIQKFFDVINHDVILNAYDSLVSRLGSNERPDERARRILKAYLDVYSFPRNLETSEDPEVVAKRDCVERVKETAIRKFYPGENLSELSLGIPQGGALSPVLANVVMDAVDRAVLSRADKNLFYARFCDDIIIVHTSKRKCDEALRRYLKAVRELKLPIHAFAKGVAGAADYFTAKSKRPVSWREPSDDVPSTKWVNFLGHQIRYDGAVRIRKETVEKHCEKLKREKGALLQNLKSARGRYREAHSWRDLSELFQRRMVALGVGRTNVPVSSSTARSWLSVFFSHLDKNGPVLPQLKRLDRLRQNIFRSVKRTLKNAARSRDVAGKADGKEMPRHDAEKKARYFGAPFSYYGSMKGYHRPELLDKCERITPTTDRDVY